MQIASQPPEPVEIVDHGIAKARHVRPQISGPKRCTREQFVIIRGQFEADVESLLDVSGLAGIERPAPEPYVTAIAAGTAESRRLPDCWRRGEEGGRGFKYACDQCRGSAMPDEVEEADVAAGIAQGAGDGSRLLRRAV